ncbi:MAG: hypothetical protein FWH12_08515 [Treponema sp.]|nr:hypothetical protein [Treponema sp.]
MKRRFNRKYAARLVFILGLTLMVLGTAFLFGFLERASQISITLAFLLVASGVFFAAWAIRLNKRASYLFFASFFFMAGIYLFLSALDVIALPFSRAWPLLSIFSGLALLPAGWRRYGGFRPSYFVPSCAFILLGSALLVFSLRMVPFSFRYFITTWWPLLVLLGGLTLVLSSLSGKTPPREREG